MSDELRECPFCGGEAQVMIESSYYMGGCMDEQCGAGGLLHVERDKAVAAWNRRADHWPTGAQAAEQLAITWHQESQSWELASMDLGEEYRMTWTAIGDKEQNELIDIAAAVLERLQRAPFPEGAQPPRPTVVCLCGSTRFWREFQRQGLAETMAGRIVLSIGAASGTDDEHFGNLPKAEYDRVKAMLDELHKCKIDLADEVFVISQEGYIGTSTRSEIDYALSFGKRIRWMEESAKETYYAGTHR